MIREKKLNHYANKCKLNEAIVGSLDLDMVKKLIPVIEKAISLGKGKLKGIRMLLLPTQIQVQAQSKPRQES